MIFRILICVFLCASPSVFALNAVATDGERSCQLTAQIQGRIANGRQEYRVIYTAAVGAPANWSSVFEVWGVKANGDITGLWYQELSRNYLTGATDWKDGTGFVKWRIQARLSGIGNPATAEQALSPDSSGSVAPKKAVVSLRNDKDYPVTYRLMQNGVEVGRVTLQPGEGLITNVEVPTNGSVEVLADVEDLMHDGTSWSVVPGAVTTQSLGSVTPTTEENPTPSTVGALNTPTSTGAGSTGGSGSIVWKNLGGNTGTQVDLVTNAVYREGVQELAKRLDKVANDSTPLPAAVTFPDKAGPEWDSQVNSGQVLGVLDKLPVMPEITLPESDSSFRVACELPELGDYSFTFNAADYETPIFVFKTLVRGAFAILFFFLSLRALKEAFA